MFVGYLLQRRKEKRYKNGENVPAHDITVIVPFRNEAHRISGLLESIKQLTVRPKEFIFVDDHSSDNGAMLIEHSLTGKYRVLSMPEELQGKKRAIRYATEKCVSEYILTMDADVYFSPDFFERISTLSKADMYILPVMMIAKQMHEYLYETDLVLANAVNAGISGWSRPVMASGANLLYKRTVFNQVDDLDAHVHMASGDDAYVLRDFRKNECDVRLQTGTQYAVYTETPQSFREFMDQRLRWVNKMEDLRDSLGTFLALWQFLLTLSFVVLLTYGLSVGDIRFALLLWGGKSCADLLLLTPFFERSGRRATWWLLPVYEIWFPVYSLLLLGLMFFYQPHWKERPISE